MERKTIGSFIAILRKANGLTQKDLAEKLNVSDKTISRWERDEGAPDLSLIPVIAEIFGVTSDELLRGERNAVDSAQAPDCERQNVKSEKQRQRLLRSTRSAYQTRSFIAVGVAGFGLITAMIANLGLNRAYIGFLCGAAFFLVAVVCQAIFINKAFLAVADDDMQGEEVENYKRAVITLGMKVFTAIMTLCAACLPLIVYPKDGYVGLTGAAWLVYGAAYGVAGFVLCSVFWFFLTPSLLKRSVYTLSEKQMAIYRHNFKLKCGSAAALIAVLLVTIAGHAVLTGGGDPQSIMEGTSFDEWDSFKAYMELDVSAGYNAGSGRSEKAASDDDIYYDANGNTITKEEAMRETIEDAEGNILCEYSRRNESVTGIRYGNANGNWLPVTVYTEQDQHDGEQRINRMNRIFSVVYLVEAACILVFYFRFRRSVDR